MATVVRSYCDPTSSAMIGALQNTVGAFKGLVVSMMQGPPGTAKTNMHEVEFIVQAAKLMEGTLRRQKVMLAQQNGTMEQAVQKLSKRIGFRVAPGFSERVVFRELFPRGLTLLDLKDAGVRQLNMSNIAARQELRDMMKSLNLPGVEVDF